MAKPANKPAAAPAATAAPAEDASGDFEWGELPAPAAKIGGGRVASEFVGVLDALPAPREANGQKQFANKWFPLTETVPDTITDPAEREKAQKELLRKLTNRLSGITRRLTKKDGARQYTMRAVENNGQAGVRVWRTEPKAAASEAGAAPTA